MQKPICKILQTKEEIKTYLNNISDYQFKKYIEKGMPARFEDGRWIAHTDNLDEFFRAYTRISMGKVSDLVFEDEGET